MIARTLNFSSPGLLSLSLGQLVWVPDEGERRTVPIEDIGFIILDTDRITITTAVLRYLAENNVAVIIGDASHIPLAQFVPFAAHTLTAESTELQVNASDAVCGRFWRQICRAKIINQARLVEKLGLPGHESILELAEAVKNGDPSNCEGQAARLYFRAVGRGSFLRDRYGDWPNCALNYGYAVLRAAMARAIVGSGLACFCGIHHHNRYNPYALADDLMEPYRPFVDQYIFSLEPPFNEPADELSKEHRARLLQVLTCDVQLGDNKRPLQIALSYTTGSLVRCLRKEINELSLPSWS